MLLTRHRPTHLGSLALLLLLPACGPDAPKEPIRPQGDEAALARAGYDTPGAHRQYGTPVKLGNGQARMYAVLDAKANQAPLEVGIALDTRALDGLPAGHTMVEVPMSLPTQAPLPYRYVVLNWNPMGHPPEGVYNVPHFDFHFYLTPRADVEAILPSDPHFADKANLPPPDNTVPPFYVPFAPPGETPAAVAEPRMGVHWLDVRSPELQGMLGHPSDYKPFTRTFIYGSWNGRFTFLEPMVTIAHLRSHPDEVIEISRPARYPEPGWYPAAYRITYDPQAKEYRIGLMNMSWHE